MKFFFGLLFIVILLMITLHVYNNKKMIEGITFSEYDLKNLKTNHWDEFCIQSLGLCRENNPLLVDRNPPIGCWCKDNKSILNASDCSVTTFNDLLN